MPGKRLLLILVWLLPLQLQAWTGISASIGEYDSQWLVDGETRPVTLTRYGLAVEDSTTIGLRVGASMGEFGLRLKSADGSRADDYVGEYLGLRLRWPLRISEVLTFHGDFAYAWQSGRLSTGVDNERSIDWSSTRFGFGVQLKLGILGLRPFVAWQQVDGDVYVHGGRRLFEDDGQTLGGIVLDLQVDSSGYLRFTWTSEGGRGLLMSFVRSY